MTQLQIIESSTNELDQDLTFEVSKETKVFAKVVYKKGEIIDRLISEIEDLKFQVNKLKHKKVLVTEESLIKLWDNKYDDQWDKC